MNEYGTPYPQCHNPETQHSGAVEDINFIRGPVQDKTLWTVQYGLLWTPYPVFHNPETQHSGAAEDTDFQSGPVQDGTLWTVQDGTLWIPFPQCHNPETQHSGAVEDTDFQSGPVQDGTLWSPYPDFHNPETQHSGAVEDTDFQSGPVQDGMLWTPYPQCHNPETQQATFPVPGLQVQQPGTSETEQTMICISELDFQQLINKKAECIDKLRSENEALETQMQVLKETLERSKYVHYEAEMNRKNTIKTLEFKLSEKKATEAKELSKVQQLEEALQQQKDSQNYLNKCVVQMNKESNLLEAALNRAESKLKSLQLERQEWEAECISKFQSKNEALETQMQVLQETLTRNKAVHEEAEMERMNTIEDLEFQLSEKKATEAEALSKVQQLEEALQQQKESQNDLNKRVVQMNKENNVLKAALNQTESELESLQLERQEEKANLIQSLSEIQHTLEVEEKTRETKLNDMAEKVRILVEQTKKPKQPSVWKRVKGLFKRS